MWKCVGVCVWGGGSVTQVSQWCTAVWFMKSSSVESDLKGNTVSSLSYGNTVSSLSYDNTVSSLS